MTLSVFFDFWAETDVTTSNNTGRIIERTESITDRFCSRKGIEEVAHYDDLSLHFG